MGNPALRRCLRVQHDPGIVRSLRGRLSSSGCRIEPLERRALLSAALIDVSSTGRSSFPDSLVDAEGTLYFQATDEEHGSELWKSDGTAAGTTLVADINPGSANSSPSQLVSLRGTVYFIAGYAATRGLWKSDGSAGGTVLLKPVMTATNLTVINDKLYFLRYSAGVGGGNCELWTSDGTTAGTAMVLRLSQVSPLASRLVPMAVW